MRESKVEDLLHQRIDLLRGVWRRVKWIGRAHAPDDFIALPSYYWTDRNGRRRLHAGYVGFVECKALGKSPRDGQLREHNELRAHGVRIVVIDNPELIDRYFPKDDCK